MVKGAGPNGDGTGEKGPSKGDGPIGGKEPWKGRGAEEYGSPIGVPKDDSAKGGKIGFAMNIGPLNGFGPRCLK